MTLSEREVEHIRDSIDALNINMGGVLATLEHIKDKVDKAPTHEEFNKLSADTLETTKNIKVLNNFYQRWKGAAIALIALGGILATFSSWVVNSWDKITRIFQ